MVRDYSDFRSSSGELLLDQQRFQDAVEKFDKAIEIEKSKYVPRIYDFVDA